MGMPGVMTEDQCQAGRRKDPIMRRIKDSENCDHYRVTQTFDYRLKILLIYSLVIIKCMLQRWVKFGLSTNMMSEPFYLWKNLSLFRLEQLPALKYI